MNVTDDRDQTFTFERPPRRIVSLVPSDTYTLLRLGAGERVVARTTYCVEPSSAVDAIPTIGGTKNADVEAIVALSPDVVVANQEENRKVDIERLEAAGLRVFLSFPQTVGEGLELARRLAAIVDEAEGWARIEEAEARWRVASQRRVEPVDCFVPIWMDPLMTVHGDTFISDVVELVGGRNVFSDRPRRYPLAADLGRRAPVNAEGRDTRYPRVTLEEVAARQPGLVLLPDEPHEFTEADAGTFRELAIPAADDGVRFCDGKDLMWYGLRALEGLDRLRALVDEARARIG